MLARGFRKSVDHVLEKNAWQHLESKTESKTNVMGLCPNMLPVVDHALWYH